MTDVPNKKKKVNIDVQNIMCLVLHAHNVNACTGEKARLKLRPMCREGVGSRSRVLCEFHKRTVTILRKFSGYTKTDKNSKN